MTRFAELWLRQKPGTDVALFTAMAHVIVTEGLHNEAFIAARTEGFDEYVEGLADKTPEWAEAITGVPAEDIRRRGPHVRGGRRPRPSTGAWASARARTAPTTRWR